MKKKSGKKVKENPIMMDSKKVKKGKINTPISAGDENEVKSFIIIIVVIVVIVGGIYGATELLNKKEEPKTPDTTVTEGTISYDKVSVGTILNRPYDTYYVMVFSGEDTNAPIYSTVLSKYMQNSSKKDYVKIYLCDLNNYLNKPYYNVNNDGKSNPKAKKTEEFNFGELTLLKIEKGKITKYVEDLDKIKSILK